MAAVSNDLWEVMSTARTIRRFTDEPVPDAALARVYLLYPDPWPKRRQRKRRFVSDASLAEITRVLRPGGRLAAVWNQLDVTVPWVHRLTRIMHAGDVHAARPELRRFAAPFGAEEHARWRWTLPQTAADLHGIMASRAYWLRASETTRAKMSANLDWYLHEHLGHGRQDAITLPYVTVAWRAVRP